ncbi:dihydrolipoyllysine-residue acetyltransferase [Thalassotalea euphylliae]|uniref:Dihydrolipoamide acetyltransferase component of pyruvate dehydrogenase complex n=2 Tax=Thalassotalea euphylliae TaxID=1655234 RepID=A0A3E0TIW3_9GAMM|nr:dihydrolipoyllysine-residue acetyltransferase [Thalassotalea euphylliae]
MTPFDGYTTSADNESNGVVSMSETHQGASLAKQKTNESVKGSQLLDAGLNLLDSLASDEGTSDEQQTDEPLDSANQVAANEPQSAGISEDFILPDIGEGIVECEIVEWLVAEGDVIEEDQPVADVMTDKALVQIPAICAGTVVKLYYAKGDIAKVHAPLFAIAPSGNVESGNGVSGNIASHDEKKEKEKLLETANENHQADVQSAIATLAGKSNVQIASTDVAQNGKKALASPAVRRVARELDINIHQVQGSGKKGRVYKEDVIRFSQVKVEQEHATQPQTSQPESTSSKSTTVGGKRVEAIRGVKAAMAKAMVDSVTSIPHFTYCEELDLTELIALRQQLKTQYAKQNVKLTLMPFFMKAMSMALAEYPLMNTQVNDDCSEITYFEDHNIGMAVDSKIGLLVPNVKQAQTKSILELALDIARLTEQARAGRVNREDLTGGTISISNIGAIGGTVATPIINKPEVAIVALGKVQKLPRFNESGEVEAREIMQISWSGDHRVIDGGTIARFTNAWKALLENPNRMLVNLR